MHRTVDVLDARLVPAPGDGTEERLRQLDDLVRPLTAPGHLLRRAQQVHTDAWSRLVPAVTGPQYAVLAAVAGWPGSDQKRTGDRASLDKSTAAGVVNRLVAGGWLERDVDTTDRRRQLLELSATARRSLPELTSAAAVVQRRLLDPLPPDEQEPFVDALGEVGRITEAGVRDQRAHEPVLLMARTPGYLLRRAQQLHAAIWREHVRDVTGPQYAVLVATLAAGVATHAEIGERVSLDSSSARDIIGRLTQAGWLEPVENAADRRSRPVRVTEPASAAVRLLREPVLWVQGEVLAPLGEVTRERFVGWLRCVGDAVEPRRR